MKLFGSSSPKEDLNSIIDLVDLNDLHKSYLKTRWLGLYNDFDRRAKRDYLFFYLLSVIAMLCGLLVPVIANITFSKEFNDYKLGLVTILSLITSFCTGLNQLYKYGERWKHYREYADLIKSEGFDFFGLANFYLNYSTAEDAFRHFVNNIETFSKTEVSGYFKKIAAENYDRNDANKAK